MGNDILGDDAIGLRLVRELRRRCTGLPGVEFRESFDAGLSLLDELTGFDVAIVIDAVQTGANPPGTLAALTIDDLRRLPLAAPHSLGLRETLELGRALGLAMPRTVSFLAIEVADAFTLSDSLTPSLLGALPELVDRVHAHLEVAAPGRFTRVSASDRSRSP